MGRKKKGAQKAHKEHHDGDVLRESFLELTGVVPIQEQDESRVELIAALKTLQHVHVQDENYEDIEAVAGRLRVIREEFVEYLNLEREEVFAVYRELQSRSKVVTYELIIFETIYRSYLKVIAEEEQVMEDLLQFLDMLYETPKDSRQIKLWLGQMNDRDQMRNTSWLTVLQQHSSEVKIGEEYKQFEPEINEEHAEKDVPLSFFIQDDITAESVLKIFLDTPISQRVCARILLVGPPGSGKTHTCDDMEGAASACEGVTVVRPKLPVAFMGGRVGDSERKLMTFFATLSSLPKTVVIMDDIEYLIGSDLDAVSHMDHTKLLFLSCLDKLRRSNVLFICTSHSPLDEKFVRFDKTIFLSLPDRRQRTEMIQSCLGIDHAYMTETMSQSLETLATCMLGRSRAEIVQSCQRAMQTSLQSSTVIESLGDKIGLLNSMVDEISQLAPTSLRSGVIDGYVDMTVLGAADLAQGTTTDALSFPLFGQDVLDAWLQLEALIVTPLCRADALDQILLGTSQESRRSFCGGVLLTGNPGTGKTELAMHAARVASKLLPSMKLLNVSCTSLVHKEVGGSERALSRLFTAVRAASPCILLMDGIENIAAVRGKDTTTHGTMDRILSTLLTELDGVDSSANKEGAKFGLIGITHDASLIDTALRRPGRLDKTIELHNPKCEARKLIALRELQQLHENMLPKDVNALALATNIAKQTADKTAAEIISLVEEARMASVMETIQLSDVCDNLPEPKLRLEHFGSLFELS